ncbi:S1C family serine protease [Maribacter sp. CXY002]|uniref:S1C family serine protease n=1 Tax=Maribacter luteocoastalis TaxID=3407671 RepID=UPI003B67158D
MKNKLVLLFIFLYNLSYSQQISDLYEKANAAVVLIRTIKPELVDLGNQQYTVGLEGIGSGFVISKTGEIITASHIVQTAEEITVVFNDGEEVPARVLFTYPAADVALIKLSTPKSTPLLPVRLGDSDKVRIGDQVFIIGAPYGIGQSLSVGYVSGKHGRKHMSGGFLNTEFIQTDAAINEGSSGAPMFNTKGEVIGIASFILSHSHGFNGLGFASSSNIAKTMLNKEHSIWTGIEAFFITDTMAEILNVPQSGGILVEKVASTSLGHKLGLKGGSYAMTLEGETIWVGGDIILKLEDIPLTDNTNLLKAWQKLLSLKTGEPLSFTILRKGKLMVLKDTMPIE